MQTQHLLNFILVGAGAARVILSAWQASVAGETAAPTGIPIACAGVQKWGIHEDRL